MAYNKFVYTFYYSWREQTGMNYDFQIRVTGVLVENGTILLVKQRLSKDRAWSLPGGRLEQGETMEEGCAGNFSKRRA